MSAIAFGLGALFSVGSIANGYYTQIVANTTGMLTGDAQIQHKDLIRYAVSLWLAGRYAVVAQATE